jgi:NitT/TauT family transport system substrate-binding protein
MNKRFIIVAGVFFLLLSLPGLGKTVVRVGAFPNITHAQAMVGKANGWFEKALGPSAKIQWTSFNAGPSAIEALFSGAIDMTYVGPNPAITGYARSNGEAGRSPGAR